MAREIKRFEPGDNEIYRKYINNIYIGQEYEERRRTATYEEEEQDYIKFIGQINTPTEWRGFYNKYNKGKKIKIDGKVKTSIYPEFFLLRHTESRANLLDFFVTELSRKGYISIEYDEILNQLADDLEEKSPEQVRNRRAYYLNILNANDKTSLEQVELIETLATYAAKTKEERLWHFNHNIIIPALRDEIVGTPIDTTSDRYMWKYSTENKQEKHTVRMSLDMVAALQDLPNKVTAKEKIIIHNDILHLYEYVMYKFELSGQRNVYINLKEYAKKCNKKYETREQKRDFRNKIKLAANILTNLHITKTVEKNQRDVQGMSFNLLWIDYNFKGKSDYIKICVTEGYAKYMEEQHKLITYRLVDSCKFNQRQDTAAKLADKIQERAAMYGTADKDHFIILSVNTLFKASGLPYPTETPRKSWREKQLEPFEKALNECIENGIITEWSYCGVNGAPISDNIILGSCAFEEWIAPGVNIKCKMALTPEEWNERDEQEKEYNKKKEERRKESKRRNKKQKNK